MCLREKIGPDPRNFNQRVSLGRNDLLIRTFLRRTGGAGGENNIGKRVGVWREIELRNLYSGKYYQWKGFYVRSGDTFMNFMIAEQNYR